MASSTKAVVQIPGKGWGREHNRTMEIYRSRNRKGGKQHEGGMETDPVLPGGKIGKGQMAAGRLGGGGGLKMDTARKSW